MLRRLASIALAGFLLSAFACSKKDAPPAEEDVYVDRETLAVYVSNPPGMPADTPTSPEKVELGKKLFSEKKLSRAGDVSCASCHDPAKHYADSGKAKSTGTGGIETRRNTPSLLGAWRQVTFFSDYRASTLEEAIQMHAKEADTFGLADDAALVAKLKEVAGAGDGFEKAFAGGADSVSAGNFARAVGTYLRTLSGKTRFDEYLDGNDGALSSKEKIGLKLFTSELNCKTCHITRLLGGNMWNKFGLKKGYESADLGRYEVTKNDAEKQMYKVPSLLNVSRTGPYFHDGSGKTLADVVKMMSVHQFEKEPTPDQTAAVVAFLGTLDTTR